MGNNTRWNCGCGQTASDTAACCDTCGLNLSTLEVSAAANGNTARSGNDDCCTTCGLTINYDGTAVSDNTCTCQNRPRVRRRCGYNTGCNTRRDNDCNSCDTCGNACSSRRDNDCNSCDTCGNACNTRRDNDCNSCDTCGNACSSRRDNDCNSCDTCGNACNSRRDNDCKSCGRCGGFHTASVFHEDQELNRILRAEDALTQGSLFPELVKPLRATCGCKPTTCASRRQLESFTAWELRLYLNTNPSDKKALKLWQQLCENACDNNYAVAFTGDCGCHEGCWRWLDDPWPWEYQDCGCGKED